MALGSPGCAPWGWAAAGVAAVDVGEAAVLSGPVAGLAPGSFPPLDAIHWVNWAGVTTSTLIGMKPWRAPQSSEHWPKYTPVLSGSTLTQVSLSWPGLASSLVQKAGTAKLWITSSAVIMNLTVLPAGMTIRSSAARSGGPSRSSR